MATVSSDSVVSGMNFHGGNAVGTVLCRSCKYTGKPASGDILKAVTIPAGATLLYLTLNWEAMAASTTIKIGDADDDDRFAGTSALTVTSAGGGIVHCSDYTFEADTDIQITFGGASQTDNKSIWVNAFYKMTKGDIADEYTQFKTAE